jgi:hypothetical protein
VTGDVSKESTLHKDTGRLGEENEREGDSTLESCRKIYFFN